MRAPDSAMPHSLAHPNRPRASLGAALALASMGPLAAPAQPPPEAHARVDESFEQAAPAIGAPAPDLVVYDRDGRRVRLRELLEGHYTVLILGCLT